MCDKSMQTKSGDKSPHSKTLRALSGYIKDKWEMAAYEKGAASGPFAIEFLQIV